MLAGHPVEEEPAAAQRLLVVAGRLLGRVVVPAVADLAGESLLGQLEVEVALVEDGGDVLEVALALPHDFHVVLQDGTVVLIGVAEALVPHTLLVELVVREAHFHLDRDEEGQLEALLALVDGKQGLLVVDVVLVFRFVVERDLH